MFVTIELLNKFQRPEVFAVQYSMSNIEDIKWVHIYANILQYPIYHKPASQDNVSHSFVATVDEVTLCSV